MMEPWELWKEIYFSEYTVSGDCVDWTVKVYDDEKTVRLLFQGSNDKHDWINNFNFPVKPYKKQENTLWVAGGWANAYTSCNEIIMEKFIETINKYSDKNYSTEICGYSYGGALALLAAEDLCFRTKIKAHVTTFGAPKPLFGKKTFNYVKSCVLSAKQYANVNDFIPYLVPFYGYRMLNKIKVGDKFCIFKLFHTNKYHLAYGDPSIYEER
ncbi:MAG: hypothetical protein IK002_00215 [Treponema sp.]|uniref:lipase family protein n=1 Tax=Treponema sp. TaxID=166 RepID=UPI00298DE04B|nr:hypothetical protein [Treponema sp.]MBR5932387.1 hypothetical protein [Treponema sp.]